MYYLTHVTFQGVFLGILVLTIIIGVKWSDKP